MSENKKYISKSEFHASKTFLKVNRHIDTCLSLLEKLISYNKACRTETEQELQIEDYIVDYRTLQFGYYENTLRSIYYSCYTLKNIYEVSSAMNHKKIENTIFNTLDEKYRIRDMEKNWVIITDGNTFEGTMYDLFFGCMYLDLETEDIVVVEPY